MKDYGRNLNEATKTFKYSRTSNECKKFNHSHEARPSKESNSILPLASIGVGSKPFRFIIKKEEFDSRYTNDFKNRHLYKV